MGLFSRRATKVADRRHAERARVDCDARIDCKGRTFAARLVDLSQGGARLELRDSPAAGTSALLSWNDHAHYCVIVWSREGTCGLSFVGEIPAELVIETARQFGDGPDGPTADPSRIPLGRKRSRLNLVAGES